MTTRRVVTGNDQHGKSCVVYDGDTAGRLDLVVAIDDEVWIDDPANPASPVLKDPAKAERFRLEPPVGGSVVRIITFRPAKDIPTDPAQLRAAVANAATRFDTGDAMEPDNLVMHTTRTIDYGIVLSGEIWLKLDEGDIQLGPGDVVVQRATRHGWENRSSEPCTMAFVLISSPNYV